MLSLLSGFFVDYLHYLCRNAGPTSVDFPAGSTPTDPL
jgi:hypothetical protein